VRRRAELPHSQDLTLVQVEVDVDQLDADAWRDVVLVQEAFQVVEVLGVCLGGIGHVVDEGEPVVHGHRREGGLEHTHDDGVSGCLCVYVCVCVCVVSVVNVW